MKKSIEKLLNTYERNYPHERSLNDRSTKHMFSNGEISATKPIAMHVADALEGNSGKEKIFEENFDHLLQPDEKRGIDEETIDKSELSAILHHPEFLMEEGEAPSETQQIGKEVFMHLLSQYGPDEGYEHVMKKLFQPMLSSLLDKIIDEESLTKQILGPTMSKRTDHSPEDYNKKMEMLFTSPVFEGNHRQNWKKAIPEIFQMLNGGESG